MGVVSRRVKQLDAYLKDTDNLDIDLLQEHISKTRRSWKQYELAYFNLEQEVQSKGEKVDYHNPKSVFKVAGLNYKQTIDSQQAQIS